MSRILSSFLIVAVAIFLWMMPATSAIYDFRTDLQTDTFSSVTAAGIVSANHTLTHAIIDDDTSTITITSNISEAPSFSSYNATLRQLTVGTLTANTIRTLTVTYDVTALAGADALDTFIGTWFIYIWYVLIAVFPIAGVAAILTGRI